MKTMELQIHGNKVEIDYESENVTYSKRVSKSAAEGISNYLMDEGFLDESFIEEMRSK